ncbi:MAG: hypothetical protein H0X29_11420 [Parachlamydiaceae bacterium]|nr:hypothetical protein [Parachlamydiaceae bacterium]
MATSLAQKLRHLATQVEQHASVDTYAKKLTVTEGGIHGLWDFKMTLIAYFLYWQLANLPDKRYDFLIAGVMHLGTGASYFSMPPNVDVITWNYDLQFEIAFAKYKKLKTIDAVIQEVNCFPRPGNFSIFNQPQVNDPYAKKFSILKLNGTAGLHYDSTLINTNGELSYPLNNPINSDFIFDGPQSGAELTNAILKHYQAMVSSTAPGSKYNNLFSYAWESTSVVPPRYIIKEPFDTEVLVIIGYSFPTFNRYVDRFLFENMPKLSKIYYQDPKPQIDVLTKSILSDQQRDQLKRPYSNPD